MLEDERYWLRVAMLVDLSRQCDLVREQPRPAQAVDDYFHLLGTANGAS